MPLNTYRVEYFWGPTEFKCKLDHVNFFHCHKQILKPSSQVQGPGGYHNVSLQIGPPITLEDRGRYVCLINNPQGHKHKEIFLKIADYSSSSSARNHFFDPFHSGKERGLNVPIFPTGNCSFSHCCLKKEMCTTRYIYTWSGISFVHFYGYLGREKVGFF